MQPRQRQSAAKLSDSRLAWAPELTLGGYGRLAGLCLAWTQQVLVGEVSRHRA